MSTVHGNLFVEKGIAFSHLINYYNPAYLHECIKAATSGTGAPTFATELNAYTPDNGVLWQNRGPASLREHASHPSWQPGIDYAKGQIVHDPYSPFDLTDATISVFIRDTFTSGSDLLTLTDGNGLTVDEAAGTIQIAMDDTETDALTFSVAVYGVDMVSAPTTAFPAGQLSRILQGSIYVREAGTEYVLPPQIGPGTAPEVSTGSNGSRGYRRAATLISPSVLVP